MKRMQGIERCAKCHAEDTTLHGCEGGYICDACIAIGRNGRDSTTKTVRSLRNSSDLMKHAVALEPSLADAIDMQQQDVANVIVASAAIDANAHRHHLLDRLGTDCVALAIDTASSVQAANSHERMLADQLAVAHKTALEIVDKGMLEADSVERARTLAIAVKFMDSYQRGLLALKRLRTGGEQKITIHHVTVEGGGQAIVGGIQTGLNGK